MRGIIRKALAILMGIVALALGGFAILAYSCNTIDTKTGQEWDGLGRELTHAGWWSEKSAGWLWSIADSSIFLIGIAVIGYLMTWYLKFQDPPQTK